MTASLSTSLQSSPLEDQILDCFPSGNYAMLTLIGLLDVVETTDVPTAAVECVSVPRMLINPEFVARHADTPEKLLMLVMHELHHVLLGHTTFFPNATPIDNLVFDAVINSMLCNEFPEPAYTSFFTDLYREDAFPECLLRPTTGWQPVRDWVPDEDDSWVDELAGVEINPIPAALKGRSFRRLASSYRELYSDFGSSYIELYEALVSNLLGCDVSGILLLGDHRGGIGSACGQLDRRSPDLFEAVRIIVERWPQPPDPVGGRSLAEMLVFLNREVCRNRRCRTSLRRILKRIGGRIGRDGHSKGLGVELTACSGPVPTFDRRAVVLRALGSPPLLYRYEVPFVQPATRGQKVHVYLDVSGSMESVIAPLYGSILDSHEFVHNRIHLFSTEVCDITMRQLRNGDCDSTGGTSIVCVAEHIRQFGIRKVVIVTDGFVGEPHGEDRQTLQGVKLGVATVGSMSTRQDLRDVADSWCVLPID